MPTASGALTAAEKRAKEQAATIEARKTVSAIIGDDAFYEGQVERFLEELALHKVGQDAGTIPTYQSFEVKYPAGERYSVRVGRRDIEVDGGKAIVNEVASRLEARGLEALTTMSIGIGQGRSGQEYGVRLLRG